MFAHGRPMARPLREIRRVRMKKGILWTAGAVLFAALAYGTLHDKNTRGYEGQPFTDYYNKDGKSLISVASEITREIPDGFRRDPNYIYPIIADSSGIDRRTLATYRGQNLRVPDFKHFK